MKLVIKKVLKTDLGWLFEEEVLLNVMLKGQVLLKKCENEMWNSHTKKEKMHEKMSRAFINKKLVLSSSLKISSASWLDTDIADDQSYF